MKNYNYRLLLISCLLSLCVNVFPQEWISVCSSARGEAVTMEVLQDDASCYKVKVRINGLYDQIVNNDYGTFHRLSLGDYGKLMKVGEPSLPVITSLIAIPTGTTPSVSIEDEVWMEKGIGTIYPMQSFYSEGANPAQFVINDSVFLRAYLPPLTTVGQEMTWRDIRNVVVRVCPFRYYPNHNKLEILSEFELRVDFSSAKQQLRRNIVLKDTSHESRLFNNSIFIEEAEADRANSTSESESYNYLILVGGNDTISNSAEMQEFCKWKALKGLRTKVASLDTISYYMDEIKQYISNEFQKGVRYVLLVGDETSIPLPYINSSFYAYTKVYGDYWYACKDGESDVQADVAIGRFSTNLYREFRHMVNKTIRYESHIPPSGNTLLIAHRYEPEDQFGYQRCSNTIKNDHYNDSVSFVTAYGSSVDDGGDDATNADVLNAINQGVPLVNYRGFGYSNYWGGTDGGSATYGWNNSNELFYDSQCANMDSTSCTVFFSVSANTGNIKATNNMLESLTRSYGGAAAFLGSSANGYPVPNDSFNPLLFNMLLDSCHHRLGDVNTHAQIRNISISYNHRMFIENAFSYICGGDPTIELWTANPQTFGEVNFTVNNGYATIYTQGVSSYTVSVVTELGYLLDTFTVNSTNCTFSIPTENFYVSINKKNYEPYIIYYNVDADYIQNTTFTHDAYYNNTPLAIGYGVTPDVLDGYVIVKKGAKLIINNGSGGVWIESGFNCERGGKFVIH